MDCVVGPNDGIRVTNNFSIILLFGFIFNFIAFVFGPAEWLEANGCGWAKETEWERERENAVSFHHGLMLSFCSSFTYSVCFVPVLLKLQCKWYEDALAKLFVDYAHRFKVTTSNNAMWTIQQRAAHNDVILRFPEITSAHKAFAYKHTHKQERARARSFASIYTYWLQTKLKLIVDFMSIKQSFHPLRNLPWKWLWKMYEYQAKTSAMVWW